MIISDAGIVAFLVIVVLVLYGIGRLLRNRSHLLQIAVVTSVALTVFAFIVLAGSGIGIGVYDFYQMQSCQDSTPKCVTVREQEQVFRSSVPRLIVWMTIPKIFRPACETISPEFCMLEKSYDFAPYSYFAGLLGTLIAVFILLVGLRQKRVKQVPLNKPLPI